MGLDGGQDFATISLRSFIIPLAAVLKSNTVDTFYQSSAMINLVT
jgi:hypothetical protein